MAERATALDSAARTALAQLADIADPPPVSLVPQTWGWAVLGLALLAIALWYGLRLRRRWVANRYRRAALAELAALEPKLADGMTRGAALAAIPPLLKRVALVAWPRSEVAALSGSAWVAFLRRTAGATFSDPTARLLNDLEYRSTAAVAAVSSDEANVIARAARAWIEKPRV